ncbi:MAG: MmgE/PrpD family protein, partial [bacterium]
DRIVRDDVQELLRKVVVQPDADYSKRFPAEMPCRIEITLRDGRQLVKTKRDYEGFITRPMQPATVRGKFEWLSGPYATPELRREIIEAVERLDDIAVADLIAPLARVGSAAEQRRMRDE